MTFGSDFRTESVNLITESHGPGLVILHLGDCQQLCAMMMMRP